MGREMVRERGVSPGVVYRVRGCDVPLLVDYIDFVAAAEGGPCMVAYPKGNWRKDRVIGLDDVEGPA